MAKPLTFYETLTAAVSDIVDHGFDSVERVERWVERIRKAAVREMVPPAHLEQMLTQTFRSIYHRLVTKKGMFQRHKGVGRFTLMQVAPKLRSELDRRIMASAGLIKLNREQVMAKTLQRFSGWATSIPAGGTEAAKKNEVKANIKKALGSHTYEERRVLIDQGHKFASSLNSILATEGNAIAAEWHSHFRQVGYDYREDHKDRDYRETGKVYVVRGNWAMAQGLMKVGSAGYTDEITNPGEEVGCRCAFVFVYNLRDLPPDMLTVKGKAELQKLRIA